MDELRILAEARGGCFTTADAKSVGVGGHALSAAVEHRDLIHLRRSGYAFADTYLTLSHEQRFLVRARLEVDLNPGRVALSHRSAALEHGLPLVDYDLRLADIARLDGQSGRKTSTARHHETVEARELVEVDGRPVSALPWAVWEVGTCGGPASALVVVDAALHSGKTDLDELTRVGEHFAHVKGSPAVRTALALADPKAESPGESLTRWLCHLFTLPMPESQVDVLDANGRLIGRVDFAWEEFRHVVEFDGKIKYGRGFDPRKSPEQIVMDERAREAAIRRQRWGITRLIWSQVHPPSEATARHLLEEMTWSRRRYLGR
ncbi:type IV toxin-antitoxin system AbiEi family antitoxin domain-containing protein [Mumia sp. DW29H23]|uniref:type IV toxin-antitoxin system AbiEi family antitoxin domain-containing protein n=1 Tax=Mumia sp. DW29H23 TaxID=3421241 RepID=UPI003D68DD05